MHYLRPQEWSTFFTALKPVQVLTAISLYAIYRRGQPVRAKDLWSSPQDYMVSAYFVWTVFASPTPKDTFRAILPLVFFYFIGVLTLNSLKRIRTLLVVWAFSIFGISLLALASTVGIDPFGSHDLTEFMMKGRLALNLSIFNNPNALGHAVVPVIPMLYYLLFWKRVFAKPLIVLIGVPIAVILMTVSKGAFIAAAITVFATLTFGRPKRVQIAMGILALAFGGTLLYALPRMTELKSSKTDPAIQGRVAAYTFGLSQMQKLPFGHGLGNFTPNFMKYGPMRLERRTKMGSRNGYPTIIVTYEKVHFSKAPHSAYVQNGADLGYTGLFLFIGVLYTCLRTLIMARTANNDEELIRRTLFAVVVSYAVSAWMVDFCYRATFFFFTAAVSALHRHLRGQFAQTPRPLEDEHEQPEFASAWRKMQPALPGGALPVEDARATALATAPVAEMQPAAPDEESEAPAPREHGTISWRRLGLIDLAITYLLTRAALRFWVHLIETM